MQILASKEKKYIFELVYGFELEDFKEAVQMTRSIASENEKFQLRHSKKMHSTLTGVALATLEYSHLNREDFLKKIASFHGYSTQNLWKYFNRPSPLRTYLVTALALQFYLFIHDWNELDYERFQHEIERLSAYDVYLIFDMINTFFLDEETFDQTKDQINAQVDEIRGIIQNLE